MMVELTKEELKEVLRESVREVMAEKFELTFGINCMDPEQRDAIREDMKFLRALKKTARTGGEKFFVWALGILGAGLIAFLWPQIQKYLK